MSSAALPPTTPPWLHLSPHVKHVVVAAVIAGAAALIAFKGFGIWEEIAKVRVAEAEKALAQSQQQLKQAAADRQASDQRYQQTVAQVLASNAALARQMEARDAALKTSQATLQNAPPQAVLERLEAAAGLGGADVSLAPNGLLLSNSGARTVTGQLEAEVVEKADLQDTRGQLSGVESELVSANGLIDSLRKESAGKDVVLADSQKACKAELSAANAAHKKHSIVYTVVSFALGVIAGRRL